MLQVKYEQQQLNIIKNIAQDTISTFTFVDTSTDNNNNNNNNNEYIYTLQGLVTKTKATITTDINNNERTVPNYEQQQQEEQQEQEELIILQEWSKFCETVFSYKKPSPPLSTYFLRHYLSDPYNIDLSLIRIARYNTNSSNSNISTNNNNPIVASCRLFYKRISTGYSSTSTTSTDTNSSIIAGGIGEVCTCNNHRKRTLSKQLLEQCITIMIQSNNNNNRNNNSTCATTTIHNTTTTSSTDNIILENYNKEQEQEEQQHQHPEIFTVSILHAAPVFFPVYTRLGYCNYTTTYNSILTISIPNLLFESLNNITINNITKRIIIRTPLFPNDTKQLYTIHQQYSENRFRGCIVRTINYWNTYISQELYNQLYIVEEEIVEEVPVVVPAVEQDKEVDTNTSTTTTTTKNIIGWIAIRPRYDSNNNIVYYQVRDFGCRCSTTLPTTPCDESFTVFQLLIYYYYMNVIIPESDSNAATNTRTIKIHIPTPIANEIQTDYNNNYKKDNSTTNTKHNSNYIIIDETIETDMGWMYRPIPTTTTTTNTDKIDSTSTTGNNEYNNSITTLNTIFNADCQHLIWSADSF